MKSKILDAINSWINENQKDADKKWLVITLNYLVDNALGSENAIAIDSLIKEIHYVGSKSDFQQVVLVPLKNQSEFFVGSCNKGVFIVVSEIDVKKSVDFYETRIRAENSHLDNLKNIARHYCMKI